MNTDLMARLQTLIYSNQDKLEPILEALEGVCSEDKQESSAVVTPEYKHPLDNYTISNRDIGSLVKCSDFLNGQPRTTTLQAAGQRGHYPYQAGGTDWSHCSSCTDTVKLHFKPFHLTDNSTMPTELDSCEFVALLFKDGSIVVGDAELLACRYWKQQPSHTADGLSVIGYQILSFVNPVLEK